MLNQQPPTKKIKHFSSTSLVNAIPIEIWRDEICTKLGYCDRSNGNATCTEFNDTFENYNQIFLKKHAIHVPQDTPTIEKAMELVAKLQLVPTEKEPLRIVLDKGVHEVAEVVNENFWHPLKLITVICSHITFVAKGKAQTTILGGFQVNNQQNVKFEELAITNQNGLGLEVDGSTVDVQRCVVKDCGVTGMWVQGGATVTATQCEFMENGEFGVGCKHMLSKAILDDCTVHDNVFGGLSAFCYAVVDLHGTKTDIHSNGYDGIVAENAKVNIHLPSQHNISHDNERKNQLQRRGGTIANINADGTFTHVVEDDWSDDDWSDEE